MELPPQELQLLPPRPEGYTATEVAEVNAKNYATYHEVRLKLEALQAWVTQQLARNKKTP
jgi:hypothetical protein